MFDLKKLKSEAIGFSILYVEDNDALRDNALKLLKKLFDTAYIASDGQEGLEVFKKNFPQIVITDIKMPRMDGMELTRHIKEISPDTKVVVMSAFDDSEYLYSAIELGVFRYLKKPVNVNDFAEVLYSCILEIKKEKNRELFYTHIQNIFNYQSSIVMMMQESEPVFVNQMFLNHFEVKNLEEFRDKYDDLGSLFLEHDGFLYDKSDKYWFDEVAEKSQKLFNIKMQDKDENFNHFILKYQKIPDKESFGILSFDDITELNLLTLYDASQVKNDDSTKDSKTMYKLLDVIQRNNAKIELHNYYKGISIVHDGVIVEIKENSVVLKTDFMQEKAIQYTQNSYLTSDALPNVIACDNVTNINFEKQSIEFTDIHFTATSPMDRRDQRVVPEEKHTVSLFLGQNKFHGDVSIEDISLEGVRLNLESMPIGLNIGNEVGINMVLSVDNKPVIVDTKATMFKKTMHKRSVSIVFSLSFEDSDKGVLVNYITSRQREIIREFKGMQNG